MKIHFRAICTVHNSTHCKYDKETSFCAISLGSFSCCLEAPFSHALLYRNTVDTAHEVELFT